MTLARLAIAAFVVATVGIANPADAQRGQRRPPADAGSGQHAVPRAGGREASPQARREAPPQAQRRSGGPESWQQTHGQPRSSFRQPQDQRRSQQYEWRPQVQAQPRGNFQQQPQARPVPQGRSWQPQQRGIVPRGNVQADRRYEGRRYESPRYAAPRYTAPRSYGPSYAYRDGYNGYGGRNEYRSYGYRSYAPPYGWRPHGYGPRWSVNLYFGRPYGYYGYGLAPYGYYAITPGFVYGSVRIVDAPPEAQVFVDGYYAGVVDDYDGVFQHLNLVPGWHRIEIQVLGYAPIAFDVFVQPAETITYRATTY